MPVTWYALSDAMDRLITLLEKAALHIMKLEPFVSLVAGIMFAFFIVAFQSLPTNVFFIVMFIMFWTFGIALLGHIFNPCDTIELNGMKTKVSRVRASLPAFRAYILICTVIWFSFLFLVSFYFIVSCTGPLDR
jgi:hypothetical protein